MRALLILGLLVSTAEAKPCVEEATINGLWICGEPTEAPSHGGESSILNAHYKLENRGAKPVVVELLSLEILDPKDAPTPLALDSRTSCHSRRESRRRRSHPGRRSIS